MFPPLLAIFCFLGLVGILVFLWRLFHRAPEQKSRRVLAIVCAVIVGVPTLLFMLWASYTHLFWSRWAGSIKDNTERRQRMILYQTDHRAILEAGRQMLADTNAFSSNPYITNLPNVIRDLDGYVSITPDRSLVDVELGGGFFHFGYLIFREGEKGWGTKELIPGLWYYSEGQRTIAPK